MSREAHVRFWEGVGVKLPRATHFLVLSERHLRHVLTRYFAYYLASVSRCRRTRLGTKRNSPPQGVSVFTMAGIRSFV